MYNHEICLICTLTAIQVKAMVWRPIGTAKREATMTPSCIVGHNWVIISMTVSYRVIYSISLTQLIGLIEAIFSLILGRIVRLKWYSIRNVFLYGNLFMENINYFIDYDIIVIVKPFQFNSDNSTLNICF